MQNQFLSALFVVAFVALPVDASPWPGQEKRLLDFFGDPLPKGATARFGSLRWRMPEAVTAVAISPDGKRIAAGGHNEVLVWDVATERELHHFRGLTGYVSQLVFSPDGQYLAASGDMWTFTEDFLKTWDLTTGLECKNLSEFPGPIQHVDFSPDGKTLITGHGKAVVTWRFPEGKKLREYPIDEGLQHPFAVSADGRVLAIAKDKSTLVLRGAYSGQRHHEIHLPEPVSYFEFTPDSRCLMTAANNTIRFWETATGKERFAIPTPECAPATTYSEKTFRIASKSNWARVHPDGRKVACLLGDERIYWVDLDTGKPLTSWQGHRHEVKTLAMSADGRSVVSSGIDGAVYVWNAATGKRIKGPAGLDSACTYLRFSTDGKTVVAGSNELHCLDSQSFKETSRTALDLDPWRSLAITEDGNTAAGIRSDGQLALVDLKTGNVSPYLTHSGVIDRRWATMGDFVFAPDGKRLYCIVHEKLRGSGSYPSILSWANLEEYDVATGAKKRMITTDLHSPSGLVISSKGTLAVIDRGENSRVHIWDTSTDFTKTLQWDAVRIAFSVNGRFLAIALRKGGICIWDLKKDELARQIDGVSDNLVSLCFSVDATLLALGQDDGGVTTWRIPDGKKIAELKGHRGSVWALAVSPEGTTLISGGSDGTVLRWEAAAWRGK